MYRVGIIGLGSIAMQYAKPGDKQPYTHIGGIRDCPAVQLCAVADMLPERLDLFRSQWAPELPGSPGRTYAQGEELIAKEELDILAICVKGPFHHAMALEALANTGAKVIFLEKPMACSLKEADEIDRMAKQKKKTIIIDYSRHWDPHVLHMQRKVKEGLIGKVKSVMGFGGGSVLSDCSHIIDSICQFAGTDPVRVHAYTKSGGDKAPDGYDPEPRFVSMQVCFDSGITGHFVEVYGSGREFSMEIVGDNGTVHTGMYIETKVFDKKGDRIDPAALGLPEKKGVFEVAYGQIAAFLDGGPLPECTRATYQAVNEIGFGAIESGISGKSIVLPCALRDRKIYANG